MKRNCFLGMLLVCVGQVLAAPQTPQATQTIQYLSGFYVNLDESTRTACILDAKATRGKYYQQDTVTVPDAVFHGGPGTGGGQSGYTYRIMELGQRAFKGAQCKMLTFAMPSNVTVIGEEALDSLVNLSQDTLTLPASLDSLALSSIVLPEIKCIEFLGAVPPRCAVATQGDAVNPWTSLQVVTSPATVVIVPTGSLTAYRAAEGIGDYFVDIREHGQIPTDLPCSSLMSPAVPRKYLYRGQLVIENNGIRYTAEGKALENTGTR